MTRFDLPSLAVARLTVAANLANATDRTIEGTLQARIGAVSLSKPVSLAPHENKRVVFTPQGYLQLNVLHPRLWWPWQYGKQNFYHLWVEFETDGSVSDRGDVHFGIREITSELDPQNHRFFAVNGKKILIRGAGWSPDMLLRLSAQREEDEIRYVRDMHLNTIRLEGKLMDDHFFNLCDRYGILVIAGWCWCSRWERWKNWKRRDYKIAEASLRSRVRRLRNHPSILAFFYGSDHAPPPKAEAMYLNVFREERWPNPTVASAGSYKTAWAGWTGVKMTGPYDYWLSTHPDVSNWDASTWYYTPLTAYANLTGLSKLRRVRLQVSSNAHVSGANGEDEIMVKNPTRHLAFFVHLRILKGEGGEDVHPILWQDNYFKLMPGEQRAVTATYRQSELAGKRPVVAVDGWNVTPVTAE